MSLNSHEEFSVIFYNILKKIVFIDNADLESGEDLEDSLNIEHFQSDEADTPEPQTQRSRGNVRPESGFRSIHIPAGSTKAHRRSSLRRASLRNANNDLELNALNADAADEWLPTPKEVTRRMSERRLYRSVFCHLIIGKTWLRNCKQ